MSALETVQVVSAEASLPCGTVMHLPWALSRGRKWALPPSHPHLPSLCSKMEQFPKREAWRGVAWLLRCMMTYLAIALPQSWSELALACSCVFLKLQNMYLKMPLPAPACTSFLREAFENYENKQSGFFRPSSVLLQFRASGFKAITVLCIWKKELVLTCFPWQRKMPC